MNYFNKIPTISYQGHSTKNLLARARLSDKQKNNQAVYYPYTVKEDDRSDLISYHYYDSPGYSWLIWLANDIIDPYYDMPLNETEFNNFIIQKYGSLESAIRKTKCYRNNYLSNLGNISISSYNSLYSNFKKYYDPIVDNDYQVVAYTRKQDNDEQATNQLVTVSLSSVTGTFTVGEEIRKNSTNYGFVIYSSPTSVSYQHTVGNITQGDVIAGVESGASATVLTIASVSQSLAYTESTYWEPVSYYDYEHELNQAKKEIKLLDARYKGEVESEFKRIMNV